MKEDILSEEDYEAFKAYEDVMREEDEKINKQKNNILSEVKKLLTYYKFKKLNEFLDEVGDTFNYDLVSQSEVFGSKQTEQYWFKYIFITQHTGYCGDDFSGTIFIPLGDNKFFKFNYEC